MFERFTCEARSVVRCAVRRSDALAGGHIGTEHLLLALLDVDARGSSRILIQAGVTEDGVYAEIARRAGAVPRTLGPEDAQALQSIGIDLEQVLDRVQANFGGVELQHETGRTLRGRRRTVGRSRASRPFSPGSKQVLALALQEAVRLKHREIGSHHILLGLLREGRGVGVQILVALGVDLPELRRSIEVTLARAA